jgi:cell division protein FtsW
MGTTMVFVLVTGASLFLAGAAIRHFILLGSVGGLVGTLVILAESYRLDRWRAFMDPQADPQGVGFHVNQALIALGSGGPFGLGIGASRQKFFYIPGVQTDGVFAVIGEEAGFVGAMLVLGLLAFVILRGFHLVSRADDRFASLLTAGVTLWLAYQALINMGGVTKTMPLTGIPLPFLSYGGSALAVQLAAMGIVINVSRYFQRAQVRIPQRVASEGVPT